MAMNSKLLRQIMNRRGVSITMLARRTRIFAPFLYWKIMGRAEFTLGEILRIIDALNLSNKKAVQIFFDGAFPLGNKSRGEF